MAPLRATGVSRTPTIAAGPSSPKTVPETDTTRDGDACISMPVRTSPADNLITSRPSGPTAGKYAGPYPR